MPDFPENLDTVMHPIGETLAGTYAEALLGQVPSDVEAEEVAAELDGIVSLLGEIDGFEQLLTAALLSQAERAEVVRRIFHGRVSEPVEALLYVMARSGRLGLLRPLRRAFRSALYRRQGRREVTVVTARPLTPPQRREVAASLAEMLGAEPVLTTRVDESVLGGLVVQVGDNIYDASVRGELEALAERLKKQIRLEPSAPGPTGTGAEGPASAEGGPPAAEAR